MRRGLSERRGRAGEGTMPVDEQPAATSPSTASQGLTVTMLPVTVLSTSAQEGEEPSVSEEPSVVGTNGSASEAVATPGSAFKPIRVWTGGPGSPQEKIYLHDNRYGLRPRADGSYLIETPEQLEIVQRALGPRFWPDDVPEGVESPRCEMCGWTTRSYRAMHWHLNNAHGRPDR